MTQRVLVVDDDPRLRELVCFTLERAGFAASEACDGVQALQAIALQPPDLVVLDVLMPEMDGLSLCRALRREGRLPILFLSTRGDAIDRINGLELGADDYLPKPFLPAELVSRVRAILRRSAPAEVLVVGEVRVDVAAHRVWVGVQEIELTATEFRILSALLARPGQVVSRAQMVVAAYGGGHHVSQRTLDSHLRGVRGKLLGAGDAIETLTAVGWRWRVG